MKGGGVLGGGGGGGGVRGLAKEGKKCVFKPFQDKWLFTGCFLTLYYLKNEDPVIPLSNHYRA